MEIRGMIPRRGYIRTPCLPRLPRNLYGKARNGEERPRLNHAVRIDGNRDFTRAAEILLRGRTFPLFWGKRTEVTRFG